MKRDMSSEATRHGDVSPKPNTGDTFCRRVVADDVSSQHEKQIATTDEITSCMAS